MTPFTKNQIISEADSISELLRDTRVLRGLKLESIAVDLGINFKYLAALESGDFRSLPAGVYGQNFLREYAQYLKIDPKPLIEMFVSSTSEEIGRVKKELFSKQVIKPGEMLIVPKILKNLALAGLVLICFIYLSYRLKTIVTPPMLSIANPTGNLITKNRSIEIIGLTEPETEIVINGEKILSDSTGNFLKSVSLKNGMNTITVVAQKKYGRQSEIVRQILVEG